MSTTENNLDLSLDEKRALLAQLLQEKVSQSNTFPVSFAQQRLWFLDQLEPGSPFYSIPQAIRMSGALNPQALQESLDTIVARHETLRTTLTMVDGSPMQVIAESRAMALPVIDLSRLPESDREAEAIRLATEDERRPFNLERGPLLRTSLLRLSWKLQLSSAPARPRNSN
ncbi:MAG: condensation domain-containing protein [Acidobacteria bacterium]|nr:condensation domain-containing protein [Acidobacteriota bacterium]